MPGLAPSDEQLLLGVIKQQIGSGRQLAISAGNALNTVTFSDENNLAYTANLEIDSFIMNQKFDDPRLEHARRIAAKHWGTFAGPADKALRNYFKD